MFSVTTPPSLHDGRDKMNGGYETLPSLDQKLESFRRSDQERDALLQVTPLPARPAAAREANLGLGNRSPV